MLALATKGVLVTAHFQCSDFSFSSLMPLSLTNLLAQSRRGVCKEKQEQESFRCFKPKGALEISDSNSFCYLEPITIKMYIYIILTM